MASRKETKTARRRKHTGAEPGDHAADRHRLVDAKRRNDHAPRSAGQDPSRRRFVGKIRPLGGGSRIPAGGRYPSDRLESGSSNCFRRKCSIEINDRATRLRDLAPRAGLPCELLDRQFILPQRERLSRDFEDETKVGRRYESSKQAEGTPARCQSVSKWIDE